MPKFIAEYKVGGETLTMTVKNKQLDGADLQAFLGKALESGFEGVEYIAIRRIRPKPEPKQKAVSK